jgi:hypothetical protein
MRPTAIRALTARKLANDAIFARTDGLRRFICGEQLLACRIDAVNLKNRLSDIQTNRWDRLHPRSGP